MGRVVTIDGPAASGKTSVSRELAKSIGWQWLSTGAFYRGLAYMAMETGTPLTDEQALVELAKSDSWRVEMAEEKTLFFAHDNEVTEEIYKEDIGSAASQISHFPEVRACLLASQRRFADIEPGLVAEGRDCGTVVFPDAEVKIYLTARQENRAQRRAQEEGRPVNETLVAQAQRDEQDQTRTAAPLQIPENAYVLDTSTMGFDEVVSDVVQHVRKRLKL